MRKLLIPLLTLLTLQSMGQETPPSGLIPVKNSFYIKNTQLWMDKGTPYGLVRVARFADISLTSASNLSLGTITSTILPILNSNGTGVTLPIATPSLAGLFSAADKMKLNSITGTNTGDQTLSLGSSAGSLSISAGNSVNIASLRAETTGFENANTTPSSAGLFVGSNSSSATNYSSALAGLGLKVYRNTSTALGYFEFWKSQSSSDALLYRTGSGASSFNAWHIIAAQDWVSAGYVPTTRALTINGTSLDLSANRTFNVGTVTSFGKVDGFGIVSSVSNSTTTPVHTIAADTAVLAPKAYVNNFFPKTGGIISGNTILNGTFDANASAGYHSQVVYDGSGQVIFRYNKEIVLQNSLANAGIKITFGNNPTGINTNYNFRANTNGDVAITAEIPSMLRLTGSGTGAATTISIAHGLSGVTASSVAVISPINAASAGISYVTTDATNINIIYTVAPASGTNNLSYNVSIKP